MPVLAGCGQTEEPLGEIVIGEGTNEISMAISNIDTYNPLKTQSKSVAEMLNLIYEPLFEFDDKLMPQGALAKDIVISEDRLFVKITLKENVTWHSGVPFSAYDVVYTINEIKNGGTTYSDNVAQIASAEVLEDGSVFLTLTEPVMNIEGLLSFPIIRDGSAAELDSKMDGTGAFYVSEQSVRNILLLPYGDRVSSVSAVKIAVMRSDTACVNAFELGDTDLVTSAVVNLNEKTPSGEIKTELYATNQMTFMGFNCSLEKYAEPSLRLAVSNMIDRKEIVEKTMLTKAVECTIPINPESDLYKSIVTIEFDTDGVMTKAGYTKTGGIYTDANGVEVSISILVNIESAEKLSVARNISDRLAKQGIKTVIEECEYEEYKRRIEAGEYDVFIGEMKMRDNSDPTFLTQEGNIFRYEDESLSAILYEMKICDNNDSLKSKINDYERTFTLNPPFVPLYFRMEGVVFKKDISGITSPNFYNNLKGLEKVYFTNKGDSNG